LTTASTLGPGEAIGHGTEGDYRRLTQGPGEPHIRRLDLAAQSSTPTQRTSLLHFACLTDIHILDTPSPGRFEYAQPLYGARAPHALVPCYRPHECLQLQACEAMIRTVNTLQSSPLTGQPVQFLLCTGDLTDNAQLNELQNVMLLLQGGPVIAWKGGAAGEGIESDEWDDPSYWHPSDFPDDYKSRWGFPAYPGLLDEASRPFDAEGVKLPWLSCYGNHDALVLGTALPTREYESIVTGSEKARRFAPGFDPIANLDSFIPHPEWFLNGPAVPTAADPNRRAYSREEFVRAHLEATGEPAGHGFSPRNLADGNAYYVDDRFPRVRIIVLDTVNVAGDYHGSIGARQLAWLEERLAEVHSRYWDSGGSAVESGSADRLVIIASHHGLATLINDLTDATLDSDVPRILGPQVEALLHRFPNVVLWVNGHTHYNEVQPRPDQSGRSGFWEVTTASLVEWPCQARLVEVVDNGNGTVSVICTMVDHSAPADPRLAEGIWRLAAIHRELAANDPHAGVLSGTRGQPTDRNVELVVSLQSSVFSLQL
jgi:metallophosphoesterase (TIGR03767 family)